MSGAKTIQELLRFVARERSRIEEMPHEETLEWKAADEIDRLERELSRVRGERNALRIRLQGYAGEVQRAMLRVTKTIEREVSDE